MAITNFPNGVSSFGIPIMGSGTIPVSSSGNYYFVDGTNGLAGNDGTSMETAVKTIKSGVALATKAGDTVVVLPGTYTEAAITASVAGIHIVGLGTSIKQVIVTSATDVTTLTLAATDIEVSGFYFKPATYTSDATVASIKLSNASYANIHDNRFQGQANSYNAIYSAVCNSDNVTIGNNSFMYMNTLTSGAAILGVEAGGLSYSNWKILNNTFNSCVTSVNINGRLCSVLGNTFAVNGITALGAGAAVCTLSLDLSGTSSYGNMVHGNYLGGAYTATLYKVGASGDDWSGNFAIGAGTGVAGGITTANPA
jgi:hypothetical protein